MYYFSTSCITEVKNANIQVQVKKINKNKTREEMKRVQFRAWNVWQSKETYKLAHYVFYPLWSHMGGLMDGYNRAQVTRSQSHTAVFNV